MVLNYKSKSKLLLNLMKKNKKKRIIDEALATFDMVYFDNSENPT